MLCCNHFFHLINLFFSLKCGIFPSSKNYVKTVQCLYPYLRTLHVEDENQTQNQLFNAKHLLKKKKKIRTNSKLTVILFYYFIN